MKTNINELVGNTVSSGLVDVKPDVKLQAYSIFDDKAREFMPPFFMPTNGVAIRAFGQDCKNPQTTFAKFPADFLLYHIGAYDQYTGELIPFAFVDRVIISRGSDFVA